MKKKRLDPERLAVQSFPTDGAGADAQRGTVMGYKGCTYAASCLCQTAYYYCGDGFQTLYSCDYSQVAPCPTAIDVC